ncbi:MAG: prepilin peptidase [Oscillospiraceae bacterium]|nr:prepilin peptidase [Oscillospiraceae bacterium]
MIIICTLLTLVSLLLAVLGVAYQHSYVTKNPFSVKRMLKESSVRKRVFLIITLLIFAAMAVLGSIFCEQKEFTSVQMVQNVLLWEGLYLIAWIDFRMKKIPNLLLLILAGIRVMGIAAEILVDGQEWLFAILASLLGMIFGVVIILICMFFSRGGIGAGDVKLYGIIGLYFGVAGLINIMFHSILIAAIVAVIMLLSRKAKMKSSLPMAPFVFIGLTVYYIFL